MFPMRIVQFVWKIYIPVAFHATFLIADICYTVPVSRNFYTRVIMLAQLVKFLYSTWRNFGDFSTRKFRLRQCRRSIKITRPRYCARIVTRNPPLSFMWLDSSVWIAGVTIRAGSRDHLVLVSGSLLPSWRTSAIRHLPSRIELSLTKIVFKTCLS